MNILIVEDDSVSSTLIGAILAPYGTCQTVGDGKLAVAAFRNALISHTPYDLICLDIMLPEFDGQYVLRQFRKMEAEHSIGGLDGAKVIMITALGDRRNIIEAFRSQCEGYIVKPIRKDKVLAQLRELGFIRPVVGSNSQT
jgi:two-component system, chemotaxis family, chemotaxis protein CheY